MMVLLTDDEFAGRTFCANRREELHRLKPDAVRKLIYIHSGRFHPKGRNGSAD